MSCLKVRKHKRDWLFKCVEHDETVWCGEWEAAMEAMYGHLCMHAHPCDWFGGCCWKPVPGFEFSSIRRCSRCEGTGWEIDL